MEPHVTVEGIGGMALPIATAALPGWHRELLAQDAATTASRKRQRFCQAPTSRIYHCDRFIPARAAMDMDYCRFVVDGGNNSAAMQHQQHQELASVSTAADGSRSSSTTAAAASTDAGAGKPTSDMDALVRYRETLAANLLFRSPERTQPRSLLYFHDDDKDWAAKADRDDTENAGVASWQRRHRALLWPPATGRPLTAMFAGQLARRRHIPSSPTRILDAPELRDDYYLNLVSWGDNNLLAVALDQTVYLYNTDSGAIQELTACAARGDYVTSVAWVRAAGGGSASVDRLAVGTSHAELQVWDTSVATKVRVLRGHGDRIGALTWHGTALSSGSRDATILQHDLRASRARVARLLGHRQEICGLAWSPDGRTLASGGNDNCLLLWDSKALASGGSASAPRQRLDQHKAAVKALAWCPWERHLLASGGGTADRAIKFWHAGTGRLVQSVATGSQVCGLVWSPTEKELLSSHGFSQNELCLWKYPSMARLRKFTGHTARVLHLAASPDGSCVVSAAADETLRFWNVFGSATTRCAASSSAPLFRMGGGIGLGGLGFGFGAGGAGGECGVGSGRSRVLFHGAVIR